VIAQRYPDIEIHLVLDNYRTHKHPVVKEWLADNPRFQLHFTPTSASWMNQVETWFSILHRQAIERGVFRSVRGLMDAIKRFLDSWDEHKHPFSWVKSPADVLRHPKVQATSGARHWLRGHSWSSGGSRGQTSALRS